MPCPSLPPAPQQPAVPHSAWLWTVHPGGANYVRVNWLMATSALGSSAHSQGAEALLLEQQSPAHLGGFAVSLHEQGGGKPLDWDTVFLVGQSCRQRLMGRPVARSWGAALLFPGPRRKAVGRVSSWPRLWAREAAGLASEPALCSRLSRVLGALRGSWQMRQE